MSKSSRIRMCNQSENEFGYDFSIQGVPKDQDRAPVHSGRPGKRPFVTMAQLTTISDGDLSEAKDAVWLDSAPVEMDAVEVKGLNWDDGVPDVVKLTSSFLSSGLLKISITKTFSI